VEIAPIANAYANHLKTSGLLDDLQNAILLSSMDGGRVLEVAHLFAGKHLSLSTIRRYLKKHGLEMIRKKHQYSVPLLKKIAYALKTG
jgi:hypothetical protein